ncbi:SnoaL-like domain-containing protein [Cladorrhinum sp. PSN332]|nr:SnoaL-like domain-containing protein [Cladorrhinum sp. PSN332]
MAKLFTDDGILLWGNISSQGPVGIEAWLKDDAAGMDGILPGSLDTLVAATPLINLGLDGQTAKGRFNGLRFQGNGSGKTRIQGGIYENEYAFVDGGWKISLLRYYPLYEGDYSEGWRNIGRADLGSAPPFHYTPDEAGIPISSPISDAPPIDVTLENLQHRIDSLNDEDDIRNLQHAYGYYVDRRMWTDVGDLFGAQNWGTLNIKNVGSFEGPHGIREALETWMGPEGLTQGILNEHLIFDTLVSFRPTVDQHLPRAAERMADVRGIEIALIGDAEKNTSSWRFGFFHNTVVKRNGIWQFHEINILPLVVANYSSGWGDGGIIPASNVDPLFLSRIARSKQTTTMGRASKAFTLSELQRRLNRSAAYDGTENVSNAYGFYIDFIDGKGCSNMAAVHARDGNKESPFAGFYQTRQRVLEACTSNYGTTERTVRPGISFHWRPQPVIHVSQDGRSSSLRARLLQPATDKNSAGTIRGGMYHDQMALEDGIWRLWSVTIDEFYWTTNTWKAGWSGVSARPQNATNPPPRDLIAQYPPDLLLTEMGDPRETGFMGGSGRYVSWPEIQRMWFAYRNPVTGRVPDSYWPSCVPCQHRPAWNLTRSGWQEPPTGPTIVRGMFGVGNAGLDDPVHVLVNVTAGPGELVLGVVTLESQRGDVKLEHALTAENRGLVDFVLPLDLKPGYLVLEATFLGSDRLRPGRDSVNFVVPGGPYDWLDEFGNKIEGSETETATP